MKLSIPITKTEQLPDGRLLVEGIATSEAVDSQDERLAYSGSVQALAKWLETGPAIREAHDPRKPVGRGLEMFPDDATKSITVRAFVSKGAPDTQEKVRDGTLAMLSVGGEPKSWTMQKEGKKQVRHITEWDMHELSLVDRGANPDCFVTLFKTDQATAAVDGGHMAKAKADEKPEPEEQTPPAAEEQKPEEKPDEAAPAEGEKPEEEKAEAPIAEGEKYASIEAAKAALKSRIEECVKAEEMALAEAQKARASIAASAEGFGLSDMLPKEWGAKAKKAKKSATPGMRKDDKAAWDIRQALDCLAGLEALKVSEQYEQMAGLTEPPQQLALLDAAITALKAFVASEAQELATGGDAAPVETAEPVAAVEAAIKPLMTKVDGIEKRLADSPAEATLRKMAEKTDAIEKALGDLKALTGEVKATREAIEYVKTLPFPGGPRVRYTPEMAKAAGMNSNDRVRLVEEMLAAAPLEQQPFLRVELERAKAAASAAGV